jgi:hypothetical protein
LTKEVGYAILNYIPILLLPSRGKTDERTWGVSNLDKGT